jgi:hypothetical protein
LRYWYSYPLEVREQILSFGEGSFYLINSNQCLSMDNFSHYYEFFTYSPRRPFTSFRVTDKMSF